MLGAHIGLEGDVSRRFVKGFLRRWRGGFQLSFGGVGLVDIGLGIQFHVGGREADDGERIAWHLNLEAFAGGWRESQISQGDV